MFQNRKQLNKTEAKETFRSLQQEKKDRKRNVFDNSLLPLGISRNVFSVNARSCIFVCMFMMLLAQRSSVYEVEAL